MTERPGEASAVRRLAVAAEQLVVAIDALAAGQRWIRRSQIGVIAALALIVVSLGAALYGAYTIWDCTSEHGRCYKLNRDRSGALIRQLIDADRANTQRSGECMLSAGDVVTYRRCVARP